METSNISWTDGTWNPWYGCDKVSSECKNCYIDRFLVRRGLEPWGEVYRAETTWTLPFKMQKRAETEHKRLKLFTCSLSDFFHAAADQWRPEAWTIMRKCPDVDFLVLTKRADRIAQHLPEDWGQGYPNVWLGVSIGVMKTAWRADELRKAPAVVRFISAEPLLESLGALDLTGIHWLISGGESGPNHRPMKLRWAEELRKKCQGSGTVFFFKQVSAPLSGEGEKALGKVYHSWPNPKLVQIDGAEAQCS